MWKNASQVSYNIKTKAKIDTAQRYYKQMERSKRAKNIQI